VAELREWKFAVEEDWEQRGCSGVTQECSALLADYYDLGLTLGVASYCWEALVKMQKARPLEGKKTQVALQQPLQGKESPPSCQKWVKKP